MNKKDVILAIICGLAVSWVASDFFPEYELVFFIVLPLLSVVGLLLCDIIGQKYLFIRQSGKFVLAGAFADVIDIKMFQLLISFAPFSIFFKGVSFIIAIIIKYLANKHWSFERHEKDGTGREVVQFFLVSFVGLAIDVVSFHYFKKISVGLSEDLWIELCIIFAALIAAVWNFLGYKFWVFKK